MRIFKIPKNKKEQKTAEQQSVSNTQVSVDNDLKEIKTIGSVILRPSFSEKANLMQTLGQYIFFVSKNSNKKSIKKYIETRYSVRVVGVNIVNAQGKIKRWLNRKNRRPAFKKAIVSLKTGDKIEIA